MAQTASTIRTNVKAQVRSIPSTDTGADSEILRHINYSLHKLWTLHDWRWLDLAFSFETKADVTDYTLPADGNYNLAYGSIYQMRILDSSQPALERRRLQEILKSDPNLTNSGFPVFYAETGLDQVSNPDSTDVTKRYPGRIFLYPVPDGVYQIEGRGRRRFEELAASDETPVPSDYDMVLEAMTLARFFDFDGDAERANRWERESRELLAALVTRDMNPRDERTIPGGTRANIRGLGIGARAGLMTIASPNPTTLIQGP